MTRALLQTLVRAGWVAAPAWALLLLQAPAALGGEPARLRPVSLPAPAPDVLTPDEFREQETAVQLAWLADPVTFGHNLGAQVGLQGLRVSGYVPSDLVREQVLELARRHTTLAVEDALKVHPGLYVRFADPQPVGELQRQARALLARAFPEHARAIAATAQDDGTVMVTGVCSSQGVRLAVSKCLRQLGPCACVENQLSVQGVPAAAPVALRAPAPAEMPLPPAAKPLPQAQSAPAVPPSRPALDKRPPVPAVASWTGWSPPGPVPPTPARVPPAAGDHQLASYRIGTTTLDEPQPQPEATPAVRLQKAIQAACGGTARDARVTVQPGGKLDVAFRAGTATEGERLYRQIAQLPELAPYTLSVKVQIGR
jgi:hypothetical protein